MANSTSGFCHATVYPVFAGQAVRLKGLNKYAASQRRSLLHGLKCPTLIKPILNYY